MTRTNTQALVSAVEIRHRRRNPPSGGVPCRHTIRCQPPDLVPCCQAPSRHRHSPPKQRPILLARPSSLPQPFVPAVVLSLKVVPTRQRILVFPLLPSLCRQRIGIFTIATFRGVFAASEPAFTQQVPNYSCTVVVYYSITAI